MEPQILFLYLSLFILSLNFFFTNLKPRLVRLFQPSLESRVKTALLSRKEVAAFLDSPIVEDEEGEEREEEEEGGIVSNANFTFEFDPYMMSKAE